MATAHCAVYNADGSLQFDLSNRLFRTLTSVITGTSDGSQTIAGLDTGTAVIAQVASSQTLQPPTLSVSGSRLSWSFGSTPMAQRQGVTANIMVY